MKFEILGHEISSLSGGVLGYQISETKIRQSGKHKGKPYVANIRYFPTLKSTLETIIDIDMASDEDIKSINALIMRLSEIEREIKSLKIPC